MNIVIYDGLNWVRHCLEQTNISLRILFSEQFVHPPNTKIFWVWEGRNGNARRRAMYPDYKKNRVKPHEDIFKTIQLFRDALQYAPVFQVHVDTYEGDDTVATLARMLGDDDKVHIWSTDKDFRALCADPRITCSANPIVEVEDKFVHLYKTLVGDPSDTIPGLPRFGNVAFQHCDKQYLTDNFSRGNFYEFSPDFAFLDAKHYFNLQKHWEQIEVFWKITEFFTIPMNELTQNLTTSVNVNHNLGMELFNKYLIH